MLEPIALWMEMSPPAVAMRGGPWLYPAVAIFHLLGTVLLSGAVVLLHLRVLLGNRRVLLRDLADYLVPWAWAGLALALVTGALLFASQATSLVDNPLLVAKFTLLGAAAVNGGLFLSNRRFRRAAPVPLMRAAAGVSLVLWFLILAVSRLLAYV